MAVEIVRFLVEKFSNDLKEEATAEFPFKKKFLEINKDLSVISNKLKGTNIDVSSENADLLRESIYALDDMLVEWQMLSKKKNESGRNWKNFYPPTKWLQTWSSLRKIKSDIQKVKSDLQGVERSDGQPSPSGTNIVDRWTSRDVNESQIFGFKKAVDDIIETLLRQGHEGIKVSSIVGMGGVGKTTLAQMVFRDTQVRSHFAIRLWIYVSPTCNKKELVKRMLLNLGVEEGLLESISPAGAADSSSDVGLGELLFTLYLKLFGKRYLIIFDDVWKSDDWYCSLGSEPPRDAGWSGRLAHGLPKGNGSAIIFTTRLEEVAEKMRSGGDIYRHLPLDPKGEAMWSIVETSFKNADTKLLTGSQKIELGNMKEEILETCGGLPLAAKTVGEILRTLESATSS